MFSRFITIILLLLPFVCLSQIKGDSKIIIHPKDTTNLFNRVALMLYEKGYTIEEKDKELGFISTKDKPVDALGSMKARFIFKSDSIIISGLSALDVKLSLFGEKRERTFEPVLNRGTKGSFFKNCWTILDELAKSIEGTFNYTK